MFDFLSSPDTSAALFRVCMVIIMLRVMNLLEEIRDKK
jgi:hypothetical protein